jgi:hypothetical protein
MITITVVAMAAQIAVQSASPPLQPEEAVRILRASRSIADRTDVRSYPFPESRSIRSVRSDAREGPFGELSSTPLSVSYRGPFVHYTAWEQARRKDREIHVTQTIPGGGRCP